MATISSPTGTSFSLSIVAYAYESPYDIEANFLNIHAVGNDGRREWVLDGDWCLTWELLQLTLWLDAVAFGNLNLWSTSGVEPWPDFDVHWEPPSKPKVSIETAHHTPEGNDPVTLWFPYDPVALRTFATELSDELEPFPIRRAEVGRHADDWIATLDEWRRDNTLHTLVQHRALPRYVGV